MVKNIVIIIQLAIVAALLFYVDHQHQQIKAEKEFMYQLVNSAQESYRDLNHNCIERLIHCEQMRIEEEESSPSEMVALLQEINREVD